MDGIPGLLGAYDVSVEDGYGQLDDGQAVLDEDDKVEACRVNDGRAGASSPILAAVAMGLYWQALLHWKQKRGPSTSIQLAHPDRRRR